MSPSRWWPVLSFLAVTGCSAAARVADQITVAPEDHHSYRSYRAAESLESKLTAAWAYVKTQPQGHYRKEVGSWFLSAERGYRARAEHRPELLRRYLQLLPDAPNAGLVRERLAELELAKTLKRRKDAELTLQAREFESQLADAKRQRDAFIRGLSQWIGRLSTLSPWGGQVGELRQDFLVVYTLQAPAAGCQRDACVKQLSFRYVVPERGALAARSGEVDVVLRLQKDYRVMSAEIDGYGLFDRLSEASQLTLVRPGDALARAEAIGRAVQIIGQALDARFPVGRCAREAVSPVVLERECDGLRVRVIAALQPELPDRIVLEPVTAAPPAASGR